MAVRRDPGVSELSRRGNSIYPLGSAPQRKRPFVPHLMGDGRGVLALPWKWCVLHTDVAPPASLHGSIMSACVALQ